MRKMGRRWLAGLLSCLMVLTSGSFTALAEETVEEAAATVQTVEDSAVTDAESTTVTATADTASTDEDVTVLYSGTSGDLDWSITSDGVLTITGDGEGDNGYWLWIGVEGYEYVYVYDWAWLGYSDYITSAVVDITGITNMAHMFEYCKNLVSIDFSGTDISNVTDMSYMFYRCESLTSVDFGNTGTSDVTNMSYMFYECESLTSVDFGNTDTSNVTDMSCMFYYCKKLSDLDVSNFDTSKVTDMSAMFGNCQSLESLDVSGFDTSNVTDMSNMFYYCQSLESLDVSGFNTSNVTDMSSMFHYCKGLESLDVSGFDTSNVTNMKSMFSNCRNLTNLDVSGFDTSNVANMYHMFDRCRELVTIDTSGFNTSNVKDMSYMFYCCESIECIDVSSFDTSNVTDIILMFDGCSSLESLDLSNFDTSGVTDSFDLVYNYLVTDCISLTYLVLPANLTLHVDLPVVNGYYWTDESGTVCTKAATGLSTSAAYTRYEKETDLTKATITLSSTSYTYDGSAKKPSVTVKCGNIKLTANTDYTVSYSNNTNPGTATVTITGKGDYTGTVKKTFTIKLASAKVSSLTNVTSGVTVKWGKISGATGYYIYRKVSGGSYSLVKTITSGSTVSYTDTAVKSSSGKTYVYYVIAYYKNSSGTIVKGASGNTKTIKRLSSATVSSLTNTSSGITVKWGKITGANGYYVYRKVSGGSYSLIKTITSGSTVSYTDTAVKSKNGTTYYYYVIPYYKNSSGAVTKGSYANTKIMVRLTAVSISSLKNSSSKKMTVKWAKNSKATGYQIQYSTSSSFGSGNKTITVTSASTVSKVISSLTKGKTYYVRVRAYKSVGGTKYYSAWSSKKSVKISK